MLTPPGAASAEPTEDYPSFSTNSLPLAAFLESRGRRADLQLNAAGRGVFTFPATPDLHTDLRAYQDGTASVSPAEYESARISLLNRISAARGGAR